MIVGLLAGLLLGAIALIVAQRAELRAVRGQLERQLSHGRRIDRVTSGLPELEAEIKKPDLCPPGLQVRLDEAIGAWGSAAVQEQKRRDVAAWRGEHRSWDWVVAELEKELLDG